MRPVALMNMTASLASSRRRFFGTISTAAGLVSVSMVNPRHHGLADDIPVMRSAWAGSGDRTEVPRAGGVVDE